MNHTEERLSTDVSALERAALRILNRQDAVRGSLSWLAHQLMEIEVGRQIGAGLWEHRRDRAAHRNGYRRVRWETDAGEIILHVPKIRRGNYLPSFLAPDMRAEQPLLQAIQRAYLAGSSEAAIVQLMVNSGLNPVGADAHRIVRGLDAQIRAFRRRLLRSSEVDAALAA